MSAQIEVNPRIDQLGAHFKFNDMQARLNEVIANSLQSMRMNDLKLYQEHFSARDTELLNPPKRRVVIDRAQAVESIKEKNKPTLEKQFARN